MIVYNVTILISKKRNDEFVQWMKTVHIKEVLETGIFKKAVFCQLLSPIEDDESNTYATQYYCDSMEKLKEYYEKYAPKLRADGQNKFGEEMIGFRTELQILEEFV